MKVTLHFQQSVKYAKNECMNMNLTMNIFFKCIYIYICPCVHMCIHTHTLSYSRCIKLYNK